MQETEHIRSPDRVLVYRRCVRECLGPDADYGVTLCHYAQGVIESGLSQMDKDMARRLVQIAVGFDANITKLYQSAEDVQDPKVKKTLKDCANTIIGILNRDVILPLLIAYPDIDPDR